MEIEKLVQLFFQTHTDLLKQATRSIDLALVMRNWLFGWYIVEFEQGKESRAELYGKKLLQKLSMQLKNLGRFTFDHNHFYVDLVFYNRLLHCYVLIDLKIGELKHQDLGQMQMYVNYFDRYVKTQEEQATIGILLCHSKNDDLVELTLPADSNIFASKYELYLPSKEALKMQIESALQSLNDKRQGGK